MKASAIWPGSFLTWAKVFPARCTAQAPPPTMVTGTRGAGFNSKARRAISFPVMFPPMEKKCQCPCGKTNIHTDTNPILYFHAIKAGSTRSREKWRGAEGEKKFTISFFPPTGENDNRLLNRDLRGGIPFKGR